MTKKRFEINLSEYEKHGSWCELCDTRDQEYPAKESRSMAQRASRLRASETPTLVGPTLSLDQARRWEKAAQAALRHATRAKRSDNMELCERYMDCYTRLVDYILDYKRQRKREATQCD